MTVEGDKEEKMRLAAAERTIHCKGGTLACEAISLATLR